MYIQYMHIHMYIYMCMYIYIYKVYGGYKPTNLHWVAANCKDVPEEMTEKSFSHLLQQLGTAGKRQLWVIACHSTLVPWVFTPKSG